MANPERVEHPIVMLPKSALAERGLALEPLMARRLGGSGGSYILARRLEACRPAFAHRVWMHRSITEIALAFGFSNTAHFSRGFRQHLGMPPSDYRRAAFA